MKKLRIVFYHYEILKEKKVKKEAKSHYTEPKKLKVKGIISVILNFFKFYKLNYF